MSVVYQEEPLPMDNLDDVGTFTCLRESSLPLSNRPLFRLNVVHAGSAYGR
jgi:hypothetical protein